MKLCSQITISLGFNFTFEKNQVFIEEEEDKP